jgi:hypothetical protein
MKYSHKHYLRLIVRTSSDKPTVLLKGSVAFFIFLYFNGTDMYIKMSSDMIQLANEYEL